jgi:hypothetical protein
MYTGKHESNDDGRSTSVLDPARQNRPFTDEELERSRTEALGLRGRYPDLSDISVVLTQLLTTEELADLHLSLIDREWHLNGIMPGNPTTIRRSLERTQDLHAKLFKCACNS